MTATLAPPPEAPAAPPPEPAAQPIAAPRLGERAAAGEPVMSTELARTLAFAALAAWGALHWMSLLEPAEPGRGWVVVAVGLIAVGAMLAAGRLRGRRRQIAAIAAIVPLTALMFLAGRVADELLLPGGWSEVAGGISRGVADLPGVRVPYRGLDEWVRIVLPLGASALVVIAALLAFWPRRRRLGFPIAALLVLTALYAVPVVALDFDSKFMRGAGFTLLTVAFLRLEKLRRPDTGAASTLALVATLAALIAAPLLNREAPWFDYETWALETSASKSTTFSWEHDYSGLNWPRDGRELLRVRARQPAYWKAENLDLFDGERWQRSSARVGVVDMPSRRSPVVRRWSQEIRVSIRNLRSDQFITAGYATDVDIPRLAVVPGMDGTYPAPRTLRRGDTYRALVYTPRPSENQRRRAGIDYRDLLAIYTTIQTTTVGVPGAQHIRMTFPFFGAENRRITAGPPDIETPETMLQRGGLLRAYQLSQQLAEGARTPEEYVQRVLGHLADESFSYSETPPRAAQTLEGFLFEAKSGYCQQYSGAMALLLRMAGIPARVVTGFSTGATDTKTSEYIVRDFDAHSWVEAYYPGWGWITFDPTPAASPARSQPADAASGGSTGSGSLPRFGDVPAERGAGVPAVTVSGPWWRWPLRVLAGLAALALIALAVRRWRRGAPPALSELERALRRTRREPAPGTTLHALELRFSATPAAAGYVRALRESRYADVPSHPTRAQRRGLRSELARGAGLVGRLRAWWALPPR